VEKKISESSIDTEPLEVASVLSLPDWGGSLKRLHRPNLLGFDCLGFKGKPEFQDLAPSHPVCLQRGPYETPEEIYPGYGQRKIEWARNPVILTIRMLEFILMLFIKRRRMEWHLRKLYGK
jgi:hypothetical protein